MKRRKNGRKFKTFSSSNAEYGSAIHSKLVFGLDFFSAPSSRTVALSSVNRHNKKLPKKEECAFGRKFSIRSDCSSKPNRFRKRCHTYIWCTVQRGLLDRFLLFSPFLTSETVRCRANVVCAPPIVRVSVSLHEPETEPALDVSYLIIRSPIKATMSCPKLINWRCGCIDIEARPSVLLSLDKNRWNG